MTVANDSGKLKFRSFGIDSFLGNDAPAELFLNMNNPNGVRCAKLGIGASPGTDTLNVSVVMLYLIVFVGLIIYPPLIVVFI